jgi:hypothetical protein
MKTVQTQHAIITLIDGTVINYHNDITLMIDDVEGVQVWQPALELARYTWNLIDENVGIVWAP